MVQWPPGRLPPLPQGVRLFSGGEELAEGKDRKRLPEDEFEVLISSSEKRTANRRGGDLNGDDHSGSGATDTVVLKIGTKGF